MNSIAFEDKSFRLRLTHMRLCVIIKERVFRTHLRTELKTGQTQWKLRELSVKKIA